MGDLEVGESVEGEDNSGDHDEGDGDQGNNLRETGSMEVNAGGGAHPGSKRGVWLLKEVPKTFLYPAEDAGAEELWLLHHTLNSTTIYCAITIASNTTSVVTSPPPSHCDTYKFFRGKIFP